MQKEQLKNVLSGGIDLFHNKRQVRELHSLGFAIEQRSKHFLLIYKGSKRSYKFAVSKTPSDVRSTNNLISIICNTIPKEELV